MSIEADIIELVKDAVANEGLVLEGYVTEDELESKVEDEVRSKFEDMDISYEVASVLDNNYSFVDTGSIGDYITESIDDLLRSFEPGGGCNVAQRFQATVEGIVKYWVDTHGVEGFEDNIRRVVSEIRTEATEPTDVRLVIREELATHAIRQMVREELATAANELRTQVDENDLRLLIAQELRWLLSNMAEMADARRTVLTNNGSVQ